MLTNGVEEVDWGAQEKYGKDRSRPKEFSILMREEENSH
jgi:hypothetical protein